MASLDIRDRSVTFVSFLKFAPNKKTEIRSEKFVAQLVQTLYEQSTTLFELLNRNNHILTAENVASFFENTFPQLDLRLRLSTKCSTAIVNRLWNTDEETVHRLNLFLTHLEGQLYKKRGIFYTFLSQNHIVNGDKVGALIKETYEDLHLLPKRKTVVLSQPLRKKLANLPTPVIRLTRLDLSKFRQKVSSKTGGATTYVISEDFGSKVVDGSSSVGSDIVAFTWADPRKQDTDDALHSDSSEKSVNVATAWCGHLQQDSKSEIDIECSSEESDIEAFTWGGLNKKDDEQARDSDSSEQSEIVGSTWLGSPKQDSTYEVDDGVFSVGSDVVAFSWDGVFKQNTEHDFDGNYAAENDIRSSNGGDPPMPCTENDGDRDCPLKSDNATKPVNEECSSSASDISEVLAFNWKPRTEKSASILDTYSPLLFTDAEQSHIPTPQLETRKKIRVRRINKTVLKLEAEGLKPKVLMPKLKLHPDGKAKTMKRRRKLRDQCRKPADYVHFCNMCDAVFNRHANLIRHIEDVHYPELAECAICGSKLSCRRGWKQHEKIHALDYVEPQCIYCGKRFPTSQARSNHIRRRKGKCRINRSKK